MLRILADENIPLVREAFGQLGDVHLLPGRALSATTVRDADVLLVRSVTPVNAALLDGSRVRFVGTATIGTDHVDEDYLRRRGIRFAYAPGSNADSVADYVTAALIEVAARLHMTLRGRSLGVVGVGNVGSRVVRRALALGMSVLKNDPPLARVTSDPTYLPLDALMECDFVTLHVPLTRAGQDATYHLFDAGLLRQLKRGAVLINTARGAVVDNGALLAVLQSGHLAAAVLDVWENEPDIRAELLERVTIGTPHIAGYSLDGKVNGTVMLHRALCEFLGVRDEWRPEIHVAPPEDAVIELTAPAVATSSEPSADACLAAVATAVRHVYDIWRDDAALRCILNLPPHQRPQYFDRLRKEYPVRREFSRYTVCLRINVCPETAQVLEGLGFRVEVLRPVADADGPKMNDTEQG